MKRPGYGRSELRRNREVMVLRSTGIVRVADSHLETAFLPAGGFFSND